MKKLFILILFSNSSLLAIAQENQPQSQFAADWIDVWKVGVQNTLDVAESMPENLYSFQPNDSSKTFGDQMGHIAFTVKFLVDGFIDNNWGEYKDPNTQGMTKNEVITLLKNNLTYTTKKIERMTNEQANETIEAFGGKMLKRYVTILFIQDHLTNHRAKANLYIRMNGLIPPDYGYFN